LLCFYNLFERSFVSQPFKRCSELSAVFVDGGNDLTEEVSWAAEVARSIRSAPKLPLCYHYCCGCWCRPEVARIIPARLKFCDSIPVRLPANVVEWQIRDYETGNRETRKDNTRKASRSAVLSFIPDVGSALTGSVIGTSRDGHRESIVAGRYNLGIARLAWVESDLRSSLQTVVLVCANQDVLMLTELNGYYVASTGCSGRVGGPVSPCLPSPDGPASPEPFSAFSASQPHLPALPPQPQPPSLVNSVATSTQHTILF
jgi:hypothetical protein